MSQLYIIWKGDDSLPATFNPLYSSMNQQLFEKNLCNQISNFKNYGQFPLWMEAITQIPQNRDWNFLQWAKMKRRALVSPWRMHSMYSSMIKGISFAKVMSNSQVSHCWIMLVWRHQAVSQAGSKFVRI